MENQMKTTRDPWGSANHQGPRITPQSQQNTALEQPILPCRKPGLDIWPKQVCEAQGSFGPAEEPALEVGSQNAQRLHAALALLCSLLTACFDWQLG